jgi:hypothetical protein
MSKVKKMSFSEKSRKKTFADQNRGVRWVLKEKNPKKKHKKRQNVFFCLFLVWRKVKLEKKKTNGYPAGYYGVLQVPQ